MQNTPNARKQSNQMLEINGSHLRFFQTLSLRWMSAVNFDFVYGIFNSHTCHLDGYPRHVLWKLMKIDLEAGLIGRLGMAPFSLLTSR